MNWCKVTCNSNSFDEKTDGGEKPNDNIWFDIEEVKFKYIKLLNIVNICINIDMDVLRLSSIFNRLFWLVSITSDKILLLNLPSTNLSSKRWIKEKKILRN